MNRWSNVLDSRWIIVKSHDHQVYGVNAAQMLLHVIKAKGEILKCHTDNTICKTADPGGKQVGQLADWTC